MKIIFMGTPDFAVPALEKIIASSDYEVVAVFTAPPSLKGRGWHETLTPVHKVALSHNIPAHTPSTLKSAEAFNIIESIEADLIVVVAYGFIVPKNILTAKKYGCLNIHPSDLPKYRGAAPMQHTIINGEKKTAVCIMQMDAGLDTGDIILREQFSIAPGITFLQLHDICANIGANLLIKVLEQIETLPGIPQAREESAYAHKLRKEHGRINWYDSAYKIDCMVRGMNPWPGVYFEYNKKIIKVLETEYQDISHDAEPGFVINNNLEIACAKGILRIKKLQQEGKKILLTKEFIKGCPVPTGTKL